MVVGAKESRLPIWLREERRVKMTSWNEKKGHGAGVGSCNGVSVESMGKMRARLFVWVGGAVRQCEKKPYGQASACEAGRVGESRKKAWGRMPAFLADATRAGMGGSQHRGHSVRNVVVRAREHGLAMRTILRISVR